MEGSLVETQSILEAGSVVPPGRRIPTGELWAGNPARYVRTLTHEEILEIPKLAVAINDLSRDHYSEFLPYSTVYLEVEKFKKSLGISVWCSFLLFFNVSVSWSFACKEIRIKTKRASFCIFFVFLAERIGLKHRVLYNWLEWYVQRWNASSELWALLFLTPNWIDPLFLPFYPFVANK